MSDTGKPRGKPRGKHGGRRTGAGRKRKPSPKTYASALEYLAAVVAGTEPAHRERVTAARALLPFESPRQRAPVKSSTPTQLEAKAELGSQAEWRAKAAAIRARLGREE